MEYFIPNIVLYVTLVQKLLDELKIGLDQLNQLTKEELVTHNVILEY